MIQRKILLLLILPILFLSACKDEEDDTDMGPNPKDPDTAEEVAVDRFSSDAGTLMVRDNMNGLPAANAPINYDMAPFITRGLGPDGQIVEYYNFDVQTTNPAPIYVLFKNGSDSPVPGQLNIIDVIPGDPGYNDFWHVHKVTVPDDYVANVVTSMAEIQDKGYQIESTNMLVNCPVVPKGSTASKRMGGGETGLTRGWYKGKVVYYFKFAEKELMPTNAGMVPLSPIYVTFNENPPEGGPATGFVTEEGSMQTHNVVASIPSSDSYSPLWTVNVYDNADFENVSDLQSAMNANILATGVATVNCPIVTLN